MSLAQGQIMQVRLPGPGPFGFRLAGGREFGMPLHISKITAGGKAQLSGAREKDVVLKINGVDTAGLTHLDAQNKIKAAAVGDLTLNLQRGEMKVWNPVSRDDTGHFKVSLKADKQEFMHPGSSTNVKPRGFGSPQPSMPTSVKSPMAARDQGRGTAQVVHTQYNSPAGLYSADNIAETFKGQTEGLIQGALGDQFDDTPQPYKPMRDTSYQPSGGHVAQVSTRPAGMRSVKPPAPRPTPPAAQPATLPICKMCDRAIVGPFVKVKGEPMHEDCFNCQDCGCSLRNQGYYTVDGKIYCKRDANTRTQRQATTNNNYYSPQPTQSTQQYRPPQQQSYSPQPTQQSYRPPQQQPTYSPKPTPASKQAPSQVASMNRGRPSPSGVSPRGTAQMNKPGVRSPGRGSDQYCEGCKQIINGPFVSAMDRNWHPDHFVCAHCHDNLKNQGFVEHNGKLYCQADYSKLYAPRCDACGKPVAGNCVSALNKNFHPEHFVCAHCKQPISDQQFMVQEGKPYCRKDYEAMFSQRCASCNFTIDSGDTWVEAMDKCYHANCFNCSICQKSLEGQRFYSKGDRPVCETHAM